jgi:hypothetical protein
MRLVKEQEEMQLNIEKRQKEAQGGRNTRRGKLVLFTRFECSFRKQSKEIAALVPHISCSLQEIHEVSSELQRQSNRVKELFAVAREVIYTRFECSFLLASGDPLLRFEVHLGS